LRSLILDRHRKARVWLGELPDAAYLADRTIGFTVPTAAPGSGSQHVAAIELMTPLGGRIMYALVGGHFTPDQSGVLEVSVDVTNMRTGRPFAGSLVQSIDDVCVGLLAEYVDGVVEGVHSAIESNDRISGRLVIDCAAHGAVGSSIVAFRGVTRSLVRLFSSVGLDPDDAELMSVFVRSDTRRG